MSQLISRIIESHGADAVIDALAKVTSGDWSPVHERTEVPLEICLAQSSDRPRAVTEAVPAVRYDIEPLGESYYYLPEAGPQLSQQEAGQATISAEVSGAHRLDLEAYLVLPNGDLRNIDTREIWELSPAERDVLIALGVPSECPPCPTAVPASSGDDLGLE